MVLFLNRANAQHMPWIDCEMPVNNSPVSSLIGGLNKPEKTHTYSGTSGSSVFPILIVFVEYQNDPYYQNDPIWPADSTGPVYMDNLLAYYRNNRYGSEWWNAYSEQTAAISDYYMETSNGNLHVTGKAVHVIMDHDDNYYLNPFNGLKQFNSDLYAKLEANTSIDWNYFDKWSYNAGTFQYSQDSIIDMIYVVHRTWRNLYSPNGYLTPGSIAQLYESQQGVTHVLSNGKKINAGFYNLGSGCTFTTGRDGSTPRSPFSMYNFVRTQAHELGHYLFGSGHGNYGVMAGGDGVGLFAAGDYRFNPWESEKLGYIQPTEVDFNTNDYTLDDFSSRNDGAPNKLLKVGVYGKWWGLNEYFLLAYRTGISKWDRPMAGDTTKGDVFRQINPEYGDGLYIYSYLDINNNMYYPPIIDMECADGLFNWEQSGTFVPDWVDPNNPSQVLKAYKKTSVSYVEDRRNIGGVEGKDGRSVSTLVDTMAGYYVADKWGGEGKNNTTLYGDGTDRIYTNDTSQWTSREWLGDRWDAWRVGYNEVFSPYSSPNTDYFANNTNQKSGIFIWLHGETEEGTADLKIYKDENYSGGTMSEARILDLTPPSRPMGLKEAECQFLNGINRPVITWNHNMEPDMIRQNPFTEQFYKVYKIYRTVSDNLTIVPDESSYTEIATVSIDASTTPEFVDTSIVSGCVLPKGACPPHCWILYPVRYRVQAVDINNDVSVKSDFCAVNALKNVDGGGGIENPENLTMIQNNSLPAEFSLKQNFPNPFNPTTNIQYDLPKNEFVKIKIYDLLGREIMSLVNEFKNAGRYVISFNASQFASGVYFYKIQAGEFSDIKRMVLIK